LLLSQLFVRRGLAYAGVLACIVLYVAVLDRAVLAAHLDRLEDGQAPLPARLTACQQLPYTFFFRETALGRLTAVSEDDSAPEQLRTRAGALALELGAVTDATGMRAAAAHFATHYMGYRWGKVKGLTDFPLDQLKPELKGLFPVQLSIAGLGDGDEGLWIACQGVDDSNEHLARWIRVCLVRYRGDRITWATHVPRLSPAFVHGDDLYLYWDEWRTPQSYGQRLECEPDSGCVEISAFRFATLRRGLIDETAHRFLELEEFEKLVDATHTPSARPADGVALYDIEVLKEGSRAFQAVVDWR